MRIGMGEATFTFRVEDALKSAFGEAAKARDQTAAQLLRGFMRDYVKRQQEEAEYDAWVHREVQAGLDSANAGNLISAEEVESAFATRRAETRRKLDKSTS
jgi:predicted transcriptional regulator